MIPKEVPPDVRATVEEHLNNGRFAPGDPIVVLDQYTITKPYGWIFFYQSKRFLETGDDLLELVGNHPVVYLRREEKIVNLIIEGSIGYAIEEFERERGLLSN